MQHSSSSKSHDSVEQFAAIWEQSTSPPDIFSFIEQHAELSPESVAEICWIDQTNHWRLGMEKLVEQYFEKIPQVRADARLKLALIKMEYLHRRKSGLNPNVDEFVSRFPDMAENLQSVFSVSEMPADQPWPEIGSISEQTQLYVVPAESFQRTSKSDEFTAPQPELASAKSLKAALPECIGRYRVLRVLGNGGFGRVFLAHDDVLDRNVAIKIPHAQLISKSDDIETYLTEARIVSSLDHHSIVPVYDCGLTEDGLCYVVSKFIDGCDLATKLKRLPLTNAMAAELVATVAEALHAAHLKGVVHRDVKPANILIDAQCRPYIADFGIALRENDFGSGNCRMGTAAYMSPEQVRGEGHLVDGRSDIFSLGVVLYELVTGKMPFTSNRFEHASISFEPRPPRQIDDAIPKELERICLKALSHRVIDRYYTAMDMASDLRSFLQAGIGTQISPARLSGLNSLTENSSNSGASAEIPIRIVPKGLRSYDRDDADFFLDLLPGPKGRDGIPECVRFWKTRILADESDTFRVGVIYGPSGSGKSSFLKAAILPQLAGEVLHIYVESTAEETESRLLNALRKNCPGLPSELELVESMMVLRRQPNERSGRKLLIVLDQFEQWLHLRSWGSSDELLRAIRQCDGTHLQCIISVRDDFWMAVTQFMNELEVTLVQGNNFGVVDLFNVRHAKRVLTAIGQAYGILPTNFQEITADQKSFVRKAVKDLARNDQVIPVQLALFAEMVKDKVWTPSTLKSIGGIQGVGVTFLEETFNGRSAHPFHRLHQKAARAVLQSLLAEAGSGIKGAKRSYSELREASGYSNNIEAFNTLLQILDSDLRLITPTDVDDLDLANAVSSAPADITGRYYHLTHDYLVPSLHEWLTRKRKETRRGRAELNLADRTAVWTQQPSTRSLPSFFEWLNISVFAGRNSRKEGRQLLNAAARYYGSRAVFACFLIGMVIWGIQRNVQQTRALLIVESLASTRGQDVPRIIEKLKPYRHITTPSLKEMIRTSANPMIQLRAAMALLEVDRSQQSVIYAALLNAAPGDFSGICETLLKWGDKAKITKQLWTQFLNVENKPERRFRAGAALVAFDPPRDNAVAPAGWRDASSLLADQLVSEVATNLGDFSNWVIAFRPIRNVLYAELHRIFSQPKGEELDCFAAATILADFAADQPDKLTDLVLRAKPREYNVLMSKLKELKRQGQDALLKEFQEPRPVNAPLAVQNRIEQRRARAAVALLEFEITDPLLNVFAEASDPILATYAEDRISSLGARPDLVYQLFSQATASLRGPLLRGLAGMSLNDLPRESRGSIVEAVASLFQNDPDAGIHSAAEWALRTWGLNDRIVQSVENIASFEPVKNRHWYVTQEGHAMIVINGPVDSHTGSPDDEQGRDASDEGICTRHIDRDFAVSSTEVTFKQFLKSSPDFRHSKKKDYTPTPDCPMGMMTWHRAAEYCNWLSQLEGIPQDQWCYRPRGHEMQPNNDYLTRTGYRLPTEAEWEFVCRSGTTSAFSWGNDPEVSPRYSRSLDNSKGHTWPVGSLCPNRWGFFDMHGNVAEWIHEEYHEILPQITNDVEVIETIWENSRRVVHGGSSLDFVAYQRSANRNSAEARNGISPRLGFRIARTMHAAKLAE